MHAFVNTVKWKMFAKFQQKIFNSIVVGASQSFTFSCKTPVFLKTMKFCLKFCMRFGIT